jgi:predicted membrane protein (TIGR00267 family)
MTWIRGKSKDLKELVEESRKYMKVARVDALARRYFIMNGFDGALTILGVVLGAFAVGVTNPDVVISAGIGVSLAMGLSGAWGAYMAEKAERTRALRDLETALFTTLKDSLLDRAAKMATIWVAFVDGVSPATVAFLTITPFFLAKLNIMPPTTAVYTSVGLSMVALFALGVFLGRISKGNIMVHGFKMMFAGVVIAAILLLLRATG